MIKIPIPKWLRKQAKNCRINLTDCEPAKENPLVTPTEIETSSFQENMGTLIDLSSLFSQFAGLYLAPDYDFGSAHYNRNSTQNIPERELAELEINIRNLLNSNTCPGGRVSSYPSLSEVIIGLLRKETTLDTSRYHMHTSSLQSTRYLLQELLTNITPEKKSIGIPVPNWHFWAINRKHTGTPFNFSFFDGNTEEQLVSEFEKAARKGNIGSLVLVNPANPLGYTISESGAKEIDRVANKEGIKIVIDDVLRGTMPIGQRDSIARWFSAPYVVEGFSKRLGDNFYGNISYSLVPKEKRVKFMEGDQSKTARLDGQLLTLGLQHNTQEAIEELSTRNQAFDRGLRSESEGIMITRASPSSLVSLCTLPVKRGITAADLSNLLETRANVSIVPLNEGFYPKGYLTKQDYSFRITIGKMDEEKIEYGARLIGATYNKIIKRQFNDGI